MALAGVERLARTEESLVTLKELLHGLNFMILPQSVFPAAASQGALAIECNSERDDNGELLEKLEKMQHKDTISEVMRERQAFKSYGGGCHLAVGINVRKVGAYYLHTHHGSVDEKEVNESHLEGSFPSLEESGKTFIGLPSNKLSDEGYLTCELIEKKPLSLESKNGEFIVASSYGIENLDKLSGVFYTAGVRTWRKAVKNGHWINASSDSLGEREISRYRESIAVKVMRDQITSSQELFLLGHKNSPSNIATILPIYERLIKDLNKEQIEELKNAKYFYWTSYSQYLDYIKLVPQINDAFHMCGLGKTFDQFTTNGVKVRPVASMSELKDLTVKMKK